MENNSDMIYNNIGSDVLTESERGELFNSNGVALELFRFFSYIVAKLLKCCCSGCLNSFLFLIII